MCALATNSFVPPPAPVAPPTLRPETRGVTINLFSNLSPMWLELEIARLARAGFNLIVFPIYNNGWTLYPSDAAASIGMKPINPVFAKWNPLGTAVELAHEAGMTVWGFARPYSFHPRYSIAEHKLLRKKPKWRMKTFPSQQSAAWRRFESWNPCPINPEYRRFLGDLLTEATSLYPLEGLVVDFTAFPLHEGPLVNSPFCHCERCRRRHLEQMGEEMSVVPGKRQVDALRMWQRGAVHENILYLRYRLRRSRTGIRFMGQVRPAWRDHERSSQFEHSEAPTIEWPRLLNHFGLEQIVVDPDGETCGPDLRSRLAADSAYLGDRAAFLPMLSVRDPRELAGAMETIRRYPTSGCIVDFQESLNDEGAEFLRNEVFTDVAQVAESDLTGAAAWLLERVMNHYRNEPMLNDMMHDILRLLIREPLLHDQFRSREVIAENLHGLEQYLRRGRRGAPAATPGVMRDLALARRYLQLACLDVPS